MGVLVGVIGVMMAAATKMMRIAYRPLRIRKAGEVMRNSVKKKITTGIWKTTPRPTCKLKNML